jgi:hypothetical protein
MVNTNRFYYDAGIAVTLTSTLALVVALIVAVFVGRDGRSVSVGVGIFALTSPMLLWRLWRSRPCQTGVGPRH